LRGWIVQIAAGVAMGVALGLAIGWLWPVQYTNTAPAALRWDHRDEYVLMIATAYEVEGDLEQARARLALLDPADPAAPVIELARRLIEAGGSAQDVGHLVRLAWALGGITPELVPYLEAQS
jgi:hypothetical protein